MAKQQTELDFSKRGHQLRVLRRVTLPAGEGPPHEDGSPSPKVRPPAMLATLQAIDDCIGSDVTYCISVGRLVTGSGLSRRTVQRAIYALVRLQILEVQKRTRRGRCASSQFRILWIRLVDFLAPAGGVSAAESFAPHRATVAPSPRNGCALPAQRLRSRRRNGCADPAQTPANETANSLPRSGEGKVLFWKTHCDSPKQFTRAVQKRHHQFLQTAWQEAVAAGWQPDQRDIRRRFFAACFYAVKPPDGFEVKNPARLVRDKLIRSDWKTGRMDGQDDDFARAIERLVDGTADAPRTSRLDETQTTDQLRQAAVAQLQASKAGTP